MNPQSEAPTNSPESLDQMRDDILAFLKPENTPGYIYTYLDRLVAMAGRVESKAPEAVVWTREKPTTEGWYMLHWEKKPKWNFPVYVRVIEGDNNRQVFVEESMDKALEDVSVTGIDGLWMAIPSPTLPPGEKP